MIGGTRLLNTGYTPGTRALTVRANPYHHIAPAEVLARRDDAVLVKDLRDNTYCIVAEPRETYTGRSVDGLLRGVFTDVNRALERFNDGE